MKIQLLAATDSRRPADLFVSGFYAKGKLPKELGGIEPGLSAKADAAVKAGRFDGAFASTLSFYDTTLREGVETVLFGLGPQKKHKPGCMRKAAGMVTRLARERKARTVRVFLESFAGGDVSLREAAGIFAEYGLLASYSFDKYQQKKKEDKAYDGISRLELVVATRGEAAACLKQVEQGRALAEGTLLARDLINEPGNILNAPELVLRARKLAAEKKLGVKIIAEPELKKLKMGGILAVNQGAVTPAALITLEYGTRFKSKGTVCLIGKGVTFDTGGISIKPARDMEKMKYDMSGAAAVIGAMRAIADLKPQVHVVALAPAVENNVAQNPQRPGDIIRMYNGKTVEVLNTDAEGRLILADALAYAARYKPKAIIDLATLTGMCAYTFGDKAIALLGNQDRLIEKVKKAGNRSGERCWQLPLWEEYGQQLRGHHSDLLNIGGPYGGTITAAKFLEEFVPEKTPWVHLDIAGTAWCESTRFDCVKGATGVGVRLLASLLMNWR